MKFRIFTGNNINLPKIRISPAVLVVPVFLLLLDWSYYTLLVLASAALHEAGHIVAVFLCGQEIESIGIYPFGAQIVTGSALHSYRDCIFISLAGGAVNLAVFGISKAFGGGDLVYFFGLCNISLAALNLLPVGSLDGGEALESLLLLFASPDRVYKIRKVIDITGLLILWIAAVYLLIISEGNLSLLAICCYLFAGMISKGF